jgi:hypothetical protein
MANTKNFHLQDHKKLIAFGVFIAVFVVVYMVFESVALKIANQKAKEVNPEFSAHIDDLDLSILRGAIVLQNVTATLKQNDRQFFDVDEVMVDLSWKQLFEGNIQFDVTVNDFHLFFDKDITDAVARLPKEEKKKEALPFEIASITVRNSEVTALGYPGPYDQKNLTVNNIYAYAENISGKKGSPLGTYDMNATLTGNEKITANGHFDISAETPQWDTNVKFLGFNLGSMNETLRKRVPVSFKEGFLDLYAEAKTDGDKIAGYVKPFLRDVKYLGNNNEFKGAGHFLIETVGTFANWLLENDKKDSVATRVDFISKDGVASVSTGGAIADVIKHGLLENDLVKPGLEDSYNLYEKDPKAMQAQEEDLKEKIEEKKEEE